MDIRFKLIGNIFLTVVIGLAFIEFFPGFSQFAIFIGWIGGMWYYRLLEMKPNNDTPQSKLKRKTKQKVVEDRN